MNVHWLRIKTVVRRHFIVLWRSPHRWFDIVVWPLVDVLVWGSLGAFANTRAHDLAAVDEFLTGFEKCRKIPLPARLDHAKYTSLDGKEASSRVAKGCNPIETGSTAQSFSSFFFVLNQVMNFRK